MKLLVLLLGLVSMVRSQSASSKYLLMPSLFSDNMVLQQKSTVPIWGKAGPKLKVTVKASWGQNAETAVKADSSWSVNLKTAKAGGPYELQVEVGDSTITYRNVMLGEIWLCSGQSNMEMPLEGWPPDNPIKNSAEEIAAANYPDIRLFTVSRAVSASPEFRCVGTWTGCNPQTAAKFSAVGYFFGRRLYQELHVPIGLIVSSWGGTRIQPWIAGKFLGKLPDYKAIVEKVDSARPQVERLNEWVHSHPVVDVSGKPAAQQFENLDFADSACSKIDFNDSTWHTMMLPTYWEATDVGEFDGTVWFRKTIDIPKTWLNTDLVMELGPIDDMDETYVNGMKVGGMLGGGFWATPRVHIVPKETVNDTTLTIAVRVIDTGGGGGIYGNGVKMRVFKPDTVIEDTSERGTGLGIVKAKVFSASEKDTNEAISLAGDWKYLPVAEYISNRFYVYGDKGEFNDRPKTTLAVGPNTPTMLFNGMIAPLIPYAIKGAIWYQGESNSDLPGDYNSYATLLKLLIRNWRTDWGKVGFPFYFVQIAPWTYGARSKSYVVRDAQRLAMSVPNTGMAVTLDISSLATIHPPDKQDVGLRLASWALARNYGKHFVYSGPIYKSMKIRNGNAIITFEYADGGLVMKPLDGKTNFIIAGKDSNFVEAEVKVVGKTLVVYSPDVKRPVAVRYTWSNTEEATLFNKAGLPASTFRTDDWPQ